MDKVKPAGMPLGMPATLGPSFEERMEQVSLTLAEGDAFFVFTDGVTEATNRAGQHYGLDRLMGFVGSEMAQASNGEISSVSKARVGELDDFSGVVKPTDDITFLVARSRKESGSTAAKQPPGPRQRGLEAKTLKDHYFCHCSMGLIKASLLSPL